MKWLSGSISLFLFASFAFSQTPRSPTGYSLSTYAWVLGLSLWGGLVAHMRKYSDGKRPVAPLASAIVDIAGSGLSGVLTFLGCQYFALDLLLTALIVGISGHMGARALFLMEKALVKRFPQLAGGSTKPGDLGD